MWVWFFYWHEHDIYIETIHSAMTTMKMSYPCHAGRSLLGVVNLLGLAVTFILTCTILVTHYAAQLP